jgi:carbonic anhydrase/acetyltransferase-like protein (isoleucine patch superfamily)
MPVFKIALAALVSLLPLNGLRVLGYRLLLGYRITGSRIGFGTVIAVDEAMITGSKMGLFNLFIGPMKVKILRGASVGNRNTFSCGYWVLQEQYRESNYTRTLEIGADALITSNHYFDVVGTINLGERSWVAGVGSQFWTHGVGVRERDIVIGSDCYLGSAVRFAPGSAVGNHVLVAMGSVVSDVILAEYVLVGGVPAKVLREKVDWKSKNE